MPRQLTRLLSIGLFLLSAGVAMAEDPPAPDAPLTQADLLRPNGIPVDFYDGLRAWDARLPEVAISLWLRAAALGDARSMLRVAQEYESGKYLPRQKLLAAYFKLLAQRQGHEGPNPLLGLSAEERAAVEAKADEFAAAALPAAPVQSRTTTFEDLLRAAGSGDADESRRVLSSQAGAVNRADAKGWTPLMHAAAGGHAEVVRLLLERGATATAADAAGYSALHLAAYSGSDATVELLLSKGAQPVAASSKGMTAHDVAIKAGHEGAAALISASERIQVTQIQTRLAALGYEVGKPDGEMGPRTRTQLAIFAAGENLPGPPTTKVLSKLFSKSETRLWGAILELNFKGTPSVTHFPNAVGSKAQAEGVLLEWCNSQDGWSKCRIKAMVPQGTCLGAAAGASGAVVWSKAFAELGAAEADAMAQCRASGVSACKLVQSFCVQP